MYIPKRFKVKDEKEIWSFLKQHTFATRLYLTKLISYESPVPVMVNREGEEIVVSGHPA